MATELFPTINRSKLKTLQVNLGYRCNQTCGHCHVNAGPNRWEMMDDYTMSLIPKVIESYKIKTLDKYQMVLLYGENEGLKKDLKNKIKTSQTNYVEIKSISLITKSNDMTVLLTL